MSACRVPLPPQLNDIDRIEFEETHTCNFAHQTKADCIDHIVDCLKLGVPEAVLKKMLKGLKKGPPPGSIKRPATTIDEIHRRGEGAS